MKNSANFELMKTYDELRIICEQSGRVSEQVVQDFQQIYKAMHHGLQVPMNELFESFAHLDGRMGAEAIQLLKKQYIAHKVFKKGGALNGYLSTPDFQVTPVSKQGRVYLEQQIKLSWRFCFFVIFEEAAADFYTIEDVFSGKNYLLYSPEIKDIRATAEPLLWFNLIGFNGFCWQHYGPLVYYNGFEAGDIFFFASELNPAIVAPAQVMAHVEEEPIPYMMLLSGAVLPRTFHKEDHSLFLLAKYDRQALDTAALKKGFRTEYQTGVYRISHKHLGGHPHFAQVFFDEEKHLLLFGALTDRGFAALVDGFNAFGFDYPADPVHRVNLGMVSTAAEILDRKVVLNEYLDLFQTEAEAVKEKVMADINAFMAMVLPDINAGIIPDIEEAARKTGVDPDTAHAVVESVLESMGKFPAPGGKVSGKPTPGRPVASGKKKGSKKELAAIHSLPAQPLEGLRRFSSDDKLLLNLYLYLRAGDIHSEAPWEYLFDDEIFGVQVPGTDRVWFVSVMGADDEFPSMSFYKGFEGLTGFLEFRAQVEEMSRQGFTEESMTQISMTTGGIMSIPHIMLSFTDRELLAKEDLAAIKKSGARFRGKGHWPKIGEVVPGYVPVYPCKESLEDLYLVMKQVLVVLEKLDEADDDYLMRDNDPEDTYLVRVPSGKGPKFRWTDQYLLTDPLMGELSCSPTISGDDLAALSRLPEANQDLQIDLLMLPTPVAEKGKKAYFPFVLLMLDKLHGLVTSSTVLPPVPDLVSMYESVPQKVLDELLKTGHRPSKIEIRSELLLSLLEEILEDANCLLEWEGRMPEMDEAIGNLFPNI